LGEQVVDSGIKSFFESILKGNMGSAPEHVRIKIMVGGAPVTAAHAEFIGAVEDAADASLATALAKSFVK
jgi:hypothetical protein